MKNYIIILLALNFGNFALAGAVDDAINCLAQPSSCKKLASLNGSQEQDFVAGFSFCHDNGVNCGPLCERVVGTCRLKGTLAEMLLDNCEKDKLFKDDNDKTCDYLTLISDCEKKKSLKLSDPKCDLLADLGE